MNQKEIASMSVEDLIALRGTIDSALRSRVSDAKRDLQSKLAQLDRFMGESSSGQRGVQKGTKVAPKYRGPDGDTWAGRGARPKWLSALLRKGRMIEEFLIDNDRPTKKKK